MNWRLSEPSPPSWTEENQGFAELTWVGFVPVAAVSAAKILILNSGFLPQPVSDRKS
ncbi:hypothetical protein H6G89_24530 [Oscillatoria sp. FACHB-1407]|uniref:hypothetical protein n=1 Tax=Oscillatoria sp. FACHB-1407 TaxID=2692847 RepID=UPI0016846849|nr:hypothetical protein [Oscillatoria sp. FACHB-1407]MBD2464173.1 hypothetical protein [Oscillatoria sp. FACHB-1407]